MQPADTSLLERWGIGWVVAQSGIEWLDAELVTANNIEVLLRDPERLEWIRLQRSIAGAAGIEDNDPALITNAHKISRTVLRSYIRPA